MHVFIQRTTGEVLIDGEYDSVSFALRACENVQGADLSGYNLFSVGFINMNFRNASFRNADLRSVDFENADLTGADFTGADIRLANFSGATLIGAIGLPDAPKLKNPDQQILDAIQNGGRLEMLSWHTCETVHCIAGWLVHLAGAQGQELENSYDTPAAAALIYHTSRPDLPIPDFYCSNNEALEGLRVRARSGI